MAEKHSPIECELLLNRSTQTFLGNRRIALLEQIEQTGSISQAARNIGMSYKAAWDAVDAINNLSEKPVVIRIVGGARGGGSEVTRFGRGLINTYRLLQKEYQQLLQRINYLGNTDDIQQMMRILAMKTSARNQFKGIIRQVKKGAVSGEVVLDIGNGAEVIANITNTSIEELELAPDKEAVAIIKSSFIILAPVQAMKTSARNQLEGHITQIISGIINSEVSLEIGAGKTLTAIITNESVKQLDLHVGDPCRALIKASNIIIAVPW